MGATPWNWQTFFGVAVYSIWKDRNSLVFLSISYMNSSFWLEVSSQVHIIQKEIQNLSHMTNSQSSFQHLYWKKPDPGWLKCNSDGSFFHNGRSSSCGGVIRDERGNFIKGFMCKLNPCNALIAELHDLLYGIKTAKSINAGKVMPELDSLEIFEMVSKGYTTISYIKPLLEEAISLLRDPCWQTSISVIS